MGGAEGPPEAVVAMTARVATTRTQALKPMHQQHLGGRVPAEAAMVDSEAVVVVAMEVDVVGDGSTNDMTLAAEGKKVSWCGPSCDAGPSQLVTGHTSLWQFSSGTRQRRSMVLDVATGEQRRRT